MSVETETSARTHELNSRDDTEFGLHHYVAVVRRRWGVLFVTLAAAIAAAVAVSLAQPSKYRAETKIVIGERNSLFPPGAANAFEPFSATVGDLLESNIVARDVINRLGLKYTEKHVLDSMSVSITPQSSVLNVSIVDTNADRARAIADEIGKVFSRLVDRRFGGSASGSGSTQLTALVWDPAHVDPGRVSPRPVRNIAIAAVLGLVVGILFSFVWDSWEYSAPKRAARAPGAAARREPAGS
jgi:tyrosine-protein kinase